MKKILIVLGSALLAFTAQGTTIVYTNLGPGDTYDQNFGFGVGNVGGSRYSQAMQFMAGASGDLATVDLALTYGDNGPALVNVFLYGDASNSPDTASQIFLGTATPTAAFHTTNNSLVTLNIAGIVPVTLGIKYWLALMPTSDNIDVWNQTSPPVPGLAAASVDNGQTWFPAGFDAIGAFRVTANTDGSSVPESGGTIWLLFASVATVFAVRRTTLRRQISR